MKKYKVLLTATFALLTVVAAAKTVIMKIEMVDGNIRLVDPNSVDEFSWITLDEVPGANIEDEKDGDLMWLHNGFFTNVDSCVNLGIIPQFDNPECRTAYRLSNWGEKYNPIIININDKTSEYTIPVQNTGYVDPVYGPIYVADIRTYCDQILENSELKVPLIKITKNFDLLPYNPGWVYRLPVCYFAPEYLDGKSFRKISTEFICQPQSYLATIEGLGRYSYNLIFNAQEILDYEVKQNDNKTVYTIKNWGWGTELEIIIQENEDGTTQVFVPSQYVVSNEFGPIYISDLYTYYSEYLKEDDRAQSYKDFSYFDRENNRLVLHVIYYVPEYLDGTLHYGEGKEIFDLDPRCEPYNMLEKNIIDLDTTHHAFFVFETDCSRVSAMDVLIDSDTDEDQLATRLKNGDPETITYEARPYICIDFEEDAFKQYVMAVAVKDTDGKIIDIFTETFGFRDSAFNSSEWEYVGEAVFVDGWVLPGFSINGETIDPIDYAYEVPLQRYIGKQNREGHLYRLVNPYDKNLLTESEINEYEPYENRFLEFIIIGENVVIKPQLSGFAMAAWGGEMTIGNIEGLYLNEYPESTLAEIIEMLKNDYGYSSSMSSFDINGNMIEVPLPLFGRPNLGGDFGYSWRNGTPAYIILPDGVEIQEKAMQRPTMKKLMKRKPKIFNGVDAQPTRSTVAQDGIPVPFPSK